MDGKPFYIYHVSCLKIEQKTCFEKRWGSKENKFSRLLTSHVNHSGEMELYHQQIQENNRR